MLLCDRSTQAAAFVSNIASPFFHKASPQSLFSYSVHDNSNSDLWTFQLRNFDTPQSLIPLDTLQHMS